MHHFENVPSWTLAIDSISRHRDTGWSADDDCVAPIGHSPDGNETMIINIFPKPVYSAPSGLAPEYLVQLAEAMEPQYRPRQQASCFWQTEGNLQEQEVFAPLVELGVERAKAFMSELGFVETNFYVTQMWGNKYQQKELIPPHVHNNSFLSGVLYVQFSEGSGNTYFAEQYDSDLQIEIKQPTIYTVGEQAVPAKQGDLVMFRSNIPHSNYPNRHDDDRITIAFNMMPCEMGRKEKFTYLKWNG
ncbi:MAG: hypothetical protein DWQ31_14050 [Planctomycetota bacterium]|nr:MAG: hypothetical protein DWQ31_14050 [Planctomycetota bacterium]